MVPRPSPLGVQLLSMSPGWMMASPTLAWSLRASTWLQLSRYLRSAAVLDQRSQRAAAAVHNLVALGVVVVVVAAGAAQQDRRGQLRLVRARDCCEIPAVFNSTSAASFEDEVPIVATT